MAKKNSYFDLVEDILNEISKEVDSKTGNKGYGNKIKNQVSNNINGRNSNMNNKNSKMNNAKNAKQKNQGKRKNESQEGQSMMTTSMEGVGYETSIESLEGRSIMTSSLEGVSQMNYSIEGSAESLIYEGHKEVVKKKNTKELLELNDKNDLKRGLILSEILGKPKSLRD